MSRHVEQQTRGIAHALEQIFNGDKRGDERKTGFVLLVFPFGEADKGRCDFVSNCADRRDLVALFKGIIGRFEGEPEIKGSA
jgi:hypothetical protein